MKYILFICLFLVGGCSLQYDEQMNLSNTERFIQSETLHFDISVGYDKNIQNIEEYKWRIHIALEEIKKQLNVQFHILKENVFDLVDDDRKVIAMKCALGLTPNKREADKHINLCFTEESLNDSDPKRVLGVYFFVYGISLIITQDNFYSNINTIIHELGHFLGANHSTFGVMKPSKGPWRYNQIAKFSKESVKEIREKQNE